MLDFISSQIIFYITLILVLFVPGAFLLIATRIYKEFSMLELFILAFGSSIAVIDFLIILLGRSPFHITRTSVLGGITAFVTICLGAHINWRKKNNTSDNIFQEIPELKISRRSTILVILLIFLTIFIKTIYFKDAVFPTATDLGHHMYWAKNITLTGQLPIYAKADIDTNFIIGKPLPIADFIIGEHLIFAAISLISGADFLSAFPVITLLLIHIMTILAIFILARIFFKSPSENKSHQNTIAIIALFLIGPLFAITSPQAKFISGGVIGNDIGNLIIPITMLLFLKAFTEKKSHIFALALFSSLTLSYTHHLSTFVFIFFALFTIAIYAIINHKTIFSDVGEWLRMTFSPAPIAVIIFGLIFISLLYLPTYLNTKAIDTAVGAPSKATRTGLTFEQFKSTAGEARFVFAILGLFTLFFVRKINKYSQAFLIGWLGSLTIMSLKPNWLFIDIPSNRIASYIVFPISIIAAFLMINILNKFREDITGRNYLKPTFLLTTFFLLMTFVASDGFYDNAQALNSDSSSKNALQTYAASIYLTGNLTSADVVLKDHNYLSGDSWIKLFFMKDYNYPLSRGYFKRYEDTTKYREQCTNLMISTPNTGEAQRCFTGTGTNLIMINPNFDSEQFRRSNKFWQVYAGDAVGIFYKAL